MPQPSSHSAKVTFLDAPAAVARLRAAARQAHSRDPNIAAVVLFGSLATGGATPSSDADLLVVLHRDPRRVLDRVPDYSRPFEGLDVAIQVLPWSADELLTRLREADPLAHEIVSTGITLAGTIPPPHD